ncbi:enoyl-CoA hydratase/isomerase family protein [Mesorhizobium sp. YR577]|uniref:enoyl-CoA hydratase/isomerase family protein n=1 Tax=Mesorhizobium sp. YR577 TaxID=1884373 RepID=UPI0008EDCD7E|nr:enoyl-CoA hydratase/isomerase family protein [Mesorhizobium sp. YR577]SFU22682.1 Enoyl-CoA hydratase/isomerase [Mesorhizobium sp. YR577]
MSVQFENRDGIGVITLANPPVNAIGQAVRAGLVQALDDARAQGVKRVIITGGDRVFAAGADAREFDRPPEASHLNEVLQRLARFEVPTIAAIFGAALGGGLEIGLACRMRIAAPGATLGLPETTLGVIPGAGARSGFRGSSAWRTRWS